MRTPSTLLGIGALCLICLGCQNQVYEQNRQLHAQNEELQSELNKLRQQKTAAPADDTRVKQLEMMLAARDRELAQAREAATQPSAVAAPTPGIDGLSTTYDPKAGTLTVNVASDVLFDAGSADLKASAQATLDKVVAALKGQYGGKAVRVEGHTDKNPIRATKDKWLDNLDLSLERAAMVSRYLIQKGVKADRIATTGFGETRPKSSDQASRRVEIVVVLR